MVMDCIKRDFDLKDYIVKNNKTIYNTMAKTFKDIEKDPLDISYFAEYGKDIPAKVIFGGKGDKFVPNINLSVWDDECYLNINDKKFVVDAEIETFNNNKIKIKKGDKEHAWYTVDENTLKWDTILYNKPESNVLEYDLKHKNNLEFIYQPALTQQEIDLGFERPEKVVGSYAVYITGKANNKYKTGKFLHIYRPLLIDANGAEQYADLFIDDGKTLRITMPQEFLDTCVYPLVVDPELGYHAVGVSFYNGIYKGIGNYQSLASSSGTATKCYIWTRSSEDGYEVKLGVYSGTSATPQQNDPLEDGGTIASAIGNSWSEQSVNFAVTSGVYYRTACCFVGSGHGISYDSGSTNDHAYNNTSVNYANELLAQLQVISYGNVRISMYLEYTESGGGLSIDINDSPSIVENINLSFSGWNIDINDPLSITENINTTMPLGGISVNESITMAESFLADNPLAGISVNDALALSELLLLLKSILESVNDNVGVTEDVKLLKDVLESVNDNVTIAENIQLLKDILNTVFDNVTIAENINVIKDSISTLLINVNDPITVSETVLVLRDALGQVFDTITVSEFISVLKSALSLVFDTVTINEDLTVSTIQGTINISDSLSVNEYVSMAKDILNGLSDTITIQEFTQVVLSLFTNLVDNISISELVNIQLSLPPSTFDSVAITEFISILKSIVFEIYDSIAINDVLSILKDPDGVTLSDLITLSESLNVIRFSYGTRPIERITMDSEITTGITMDSEITDGLILNSYIVDN